MFGSFPASKNWEKSLLMNKDVEEMVSTPWTEKWARSAANAVLCIINTVAEGTDLGTAPGQEGLGLLMWKKFLYLITSCQYLCKKVPHLTNMPTSFLGLEQSLDTSVNSTLCLGHWNPLATWPLLWYNQCFPFTLRKVETANDVIDVGNGHVRGFWLCQRNVYEQ